MRPGSGGHLPLVQNQQLGRRWGEEGRQKVQMEVVRWMMGEEKEVVDKLQ